MSSFKNAIPKRKYRERGQLKKREGMGFLEKKQDYKRRAINYHQKQDKLDQLRLKASLKNPEEFYFKMINSKTQDGQHVDLSDDEDIDPKEYRKILKNQNASMFKLQNYKDTKKLAEMKGSLHLLVAPKINTKTLFFYKEDDLEKYEVSLQDKENTKNYNCDKERLENINLEEEADLQKISQKMKESYKKLSEKMENKKKMEDIYLKLDYEKNLLTKEKKKLKKYKTGKIYKFFKERKR